MTRTEQDAFAGSSLALSVIAARCQLPHGGSPWQSVRTSSFFAKASPFGRGVTGGDGEGEPAKEIHQNIVTLSAALRPVFPPHCVKLWKTGD